MHWASLQKWISAFLIGVVFLTSSLPFFNIQTTHAQGLGIPTNNIKLETVATKTAGTSLISSVKNTLTSLSTQYSLLNDTVLRKLANIMIDTMLRQMTSDIVQWINSGFQGSPAFTTDPAGLFMDIADETIGKFIEGSDLGFLCSPFRLDIRIALAQSFQPYRRKAGCTLTRIGDNVTGFIEGNNSGGWDNWLARTTKPHNNPYTSYLMAQNEVAIRISGKKEIKLAQLNWGSGFLSYDECIAYGPPEELQGPPAPGQTSVGNGPPKCIKTETKTPGSVIAGQLDWAMSSDIRRNELAKDIDQIVSALVGQVAKQALGGIGGLLGASKPQQGSGRSFLNTYNPNNRDALLLAQSGQTEIDRRINASSTAFNNQALDRESAVSTQTNNTIDGSVASSTTIDSTERNLALGKVATQSSIADGYGPHLAVDGNLDAIPSSYRNIAITNTDDRPWWEVDLGRDYAIDRVIISPRGDGNTPLFNFHLFTSTYPFATNFNPLLQPTFGVFKSTLQNPPAPYTNNVSIPVTTNGRYVRIQAVDTRSIGIAEVRVFGADIPNGGGGYNNGGGGENNDPSLPLSIYISPATTQGLTLGLSGLLGNTIRFTGNRDAVSLRLETNLYLVSGANKSPSPFSVVFAQFQTQFRNNGVNQNIPVNLNSSGQTIAASADLSSEYEFSVSYTGNAKPYCVRQYNWQPVCPALTYGTYQLETVIKDTDNTVLGRQITEFTFHQ